MLVPIEGQCYHTSHHSCQHLLRESLSRDCTALACGGELGRVFTIWMYSVCSPCSTTRRVVQSIAPTWRDLFRALVANATMNHGMHSYHQKPESVSPREWSKHGFLADPNLTRVSCGISFHGDDVPFETTTSPSS